MTSAGLRGKKLSKNTQRTLIIDTTQNHLWVLKIQRSALKYIFRPDNTRNRLLLISLLYVFLSKKGENCHYFIENFRNKKIGTQVNREKDRYDRIECCKHTFLNFLCFKSE